MRIRNLLVVAALAAGTTAASADVLVGQTPIGLTGTFTMTIANCTTPTTVTAKYTKNTVTGLVTLIVPGLVCTSASTASTGLSGLPAEILPADHQSVAIPFVTYNGSLVPGALLINKDMSVMPLRFFIGTTNNGVYPSGTQMGFNVPQTIIYQGYPDT